VMKNNGTAIHFMRIVLQIYRNGSLDEGCLELRLAGWIRPFAASLPDGEPALHARRGERRGGKHYVDLRCDPSSRDTTSNGRIMSLSSCSSM
jgi:hypothetical protein